MKICLVTPFSWSQPHDVNAHVAGIAKALRALGHSVTVLAPSGRTADLIAGRRALAAGTDADVIAIGAAVPVSRRSSLGVPVGVRANLEVALGQGGYDVVHGFEPGLPSISYLALRDSEALGVASFFSPERLGYPPRRALREKLLARIDALVATSETTAAAAAERFPGDYRIVSPGVDSDLFRPGRKRKLVAIELHSGSLAVARAALRSLRDLPAWEAVLLRTKPLSTRPGIPASLRDRVRVRSGRTPETRAAVLAEAAIVVPA
ncbi:MAG: glycosyltransferase, partial [Gaiellaceae bacterium]